MPAQRLSYNGSIERLRRCLPTHRYLYLLHQAATTGYLPTLSTRGEVIPRAADEPATNVDTSARLKLLGYLVDKTMPTPTAAPMIDAPATASAISNDDLRSMTREQLMTLVAPAQPADPADDPDEPHAVETLPDDPEAEARTPAFLRVSP